MKKWRLASLNNCQEFTRWICCAQSCPILCDTMDCSPQTPESKGFSRQECWRWLPFPPPGQSPWPRDQTCVSYTGQADSLSLSHCRSLLDGTSSLQLEQYQVNGLSLYMYCLSKISEFEDAWIEPWDFPCGSDGKASAYNAGDPGSIPGLGRSPGEGNGLVSTLWYPTSILSPKHVTILYSCLCFYIYLK